MFESDFRQMFELVYPLNIGRQSVDNRTRQHLVHRASDFNPEKRICSIRNDGFRIEYDGFQRGIRQKNRAYGTVGVQRYN